MDFEDTQNPENNESQPSPPPQPQPAPAPAFNIPDFSSAVYDPYPKKKKGTGWKIFMGILLVISILFNVFLFLGIIGLGAIVAGGSTAADDGLVEKTLIDGQRTQKIAVINIEGVIESGMSEWVQRQIKTAERDASVKALIVRISSPGGDVASSDQIHYYISQFKKHTGKPVLAFMQSIAASGGYYSAVACDKIMAEPTVITGSIGVIMNHLVLKDLLEEKLGISPVTLKSGKRKDWPSMFNETTDEEKQYLMDRIVTPAFDRFVTLVTEGRQEVLTEAEVRELADGGIYSAPEAVDNKLIDAMGYFEEAVHATEQLAQISNAQVVTYEELFSFWSLMGAQAQSKINIEAEILEKLAAPRVMYLWDGKK